MTLPFREFHASLGAQFITVNSAEAVADYGDPLAEYAAMRESAAVFDLSFRSRICLLGADRVRFLHGQMTNDIKKLRTGEGCYAALVTAKGKMVSDLNVFVLQDELLLDFEPGLTRTVIERLEKYIVADDVQVTDVAPLYGLLSVQGPKTEAVVRSLGLFAELPSRPFDSTRISDPSSGEVYLMNHPRLIGDMGFDLFIPLTALAAVTDKLMIAAKSIGGRPSGWAAFEIARIEAGIPRFGADMDETNIPLECGIEARAVSYNKGCYIGQEVINRIHSIGHVNRHLVGLRFADELNSVPTCGEKLFADGKEMGHISSAIKSPSLNAPIALGYTRREVNQIGRRLTLQRSDGEIAATIAELPFVK
jgi:folate-binding protein YgfZ